MSTGKCMKCRDYFRLEKGGNVRTHALMNGRLCIGSNMPAVLEW